MIITVDKESYPIARLYNPSTGLTEFFIYKTQWHPLFSKRLAVKEEPDLAKYIGEWNDRSA